MPCASHGMSEKLTRRNHGDGLAEQRLGRIGSSGFDDSTSALVANGRRLIKTPGHSFHRRLRNSCRNHWSVAGATFFISAAPRALRQQRPLGRQIMCGAWLILDIVAIIDGSRAVANEARALQEAASSVDRC